MPTETDPRPQTAASSPSPSGSPSSAPRPDEAEAERILQDAARIAEANRRRRQATHIAAALPPRPAVTAAPPIAFRTSADDELRARARKLAESCNVPHRYRGASLADLSGVPADCREAYADAAGLIRATADRLGVIAAVLGPRGPGKTWICAAIVQDFCREGRPAVYLHAMDYFMALKQTYSDKAKADESQVEGKYLRYRLLVLDELHERGETAWEDRMLTRLVSKRYDANLTTILISNQTPEQFTARIGETIASRITDGGGVIRCDWPSLRGRLLAQDGGQA